MLPTLGAKASPAWLYADASPHLGGPVPAIRLPSHLPPVAGVEDALTRFKVITVYLSGVDAVYQRKQVAT